LKYFSVMGRASGIRTVTPEQRHSGEDLDILAGSGSAYQAARQAYPARWSRCTRNWTPVVALTLNPERQSDTASKAAQNMTFAS